MPVLAEGGVVHIYQAHATAVYYDISLDRYVGDGDSIRTIVSHSMSINGATDVTTVNSIIVCNRVLTAAVQTWNTIKTSRALRNSDTCTGMITQKGPAIEFLS